MKFDSCRVARIARWVLLAPILPMSIFISMMGLVGLGFGAGRFVLGYVLSLPAFLLNAISTRWGVAGAVAVLLLDYVPRAIQNWPQINPFVLLNPKGDGMLVLILVLNLTSATAWKIATRKHGGQAESPIQPV